MRDSGRISLVLLLNLALYLVAGELNYFLGNFSVHIHIDALLVIFFGLYISRVSGLFCTALLGFLADAVHLAPDGTFLAGYLCMWMFFVWCQRRIRRQNPMHVRAVAAGAQMLWLLGMSVFLSEGQWAWASYWQRILVEALLSGAAAYALAWSWCQLQKTVLHSLGWDLEARMSTL